MPAYPLKKQSWKSQPWRSALFTCLSFLAFGVTSAAIARGELLPTPVGLWTTYANDNQTPVSLVRITEINGKLMGRIEKILTPKILDKRCTPCTGSNKDQALLGLEVIWNMEPIALHTWGNGETLDPCNGKTYSAKVRLKEDCNKLEVRNYLGFPLIGRSRLWVRTETVGQ